MRSSPNSDEVNSLTPMRELLQHVVKNGTDTRCRTILGCVGAGGVPVREDLVEKVRTELDLRGKFWN